MNSTEQKLYKNWKALCYRIQQAAVLTLPEQMLPEVERKQQLLTDFERFCKYYFPHYLDADFGWFHKQAAEIITETPNIMAVLEWPREHAKSVMANVLIPLWLKALGQLTGMVVASANQAKARGLLADLQAELGFNQRYITDFGNQLSLGDWRDGQFATQDGCGFWAFGRGQSPRGVRNADKRPNYGVIDDIDDKILVNNPTRVSQATAWVLEDFFGALSIKGARLIIAGNRIHRNSVLANICGDIEPSDPLRPNIWRQRVYAFEDQNHNESDPESGIPAWPERYTAQMLKDKMLKMGHRAALREFFHRHIEDHGLFKPEWINFAVLPRHSKLENLIFYCDPSWKSGPKNDYKALVGVAHYNHLFFVTDLWIRQASTQALTIAYYDLFEKRNKSARCYIEGNLMQDLLMDAFINEGNDRGYQMPIRADKRKKTDKKIRIENIAPLFERGLIVFAEHLRHTTDMRTFEQQVLGFGSPSTHDDGPDALEGAIFILQQQTRPAMVQPRSGRFNRTLNR